MKKNVPWHIRASRAVACDMFLLRASAHPRGGFLFHRTQSPMKQKKEPSFDDSSEATTRFELVIRVLQTHALPLGYVAINDPNEIRTRVTAVKGRCLNRLTMGPDIKLKLPE